MAKRQQLYMAMFLLVTMLITSMQCNTSFCTLPLSVDRPDTFTTASTVEVVEYNAQIKKIDSWQVSSVFRTGVSILKQGQRTHKSNHRRILSIYCISMLLCMGICLHAIQFAIQETGLSMPFQRLLHYIHNKDGKK